jgi:hypothetical protein
MKLNGVSGRTDARLTEWKRCGSISAQEDAP